MEFSFKPLMKPPGELPAEPGEVLFVNDSGTFVLVQELVRGSLGEQNMLAWWYPPQSTSRRLVEVSALTAVPGHKDSQRLLAWYELAAQLSHPNIIPVLGLHRQRGLYWLVSEHLTGCSLDTLISSSLLRARMPSETVALYVGVHVAAALHFLHTLEDKQGQPLRLIHRGVCPTAIRLGTQGEVKLSALSLLRAQWRTQVATSPDAMRGDLDYAAPERLLPRSPEPDGRADLFSLGLALHELLTGRHLYDLDEVEQATLRAEPPWESLSPVRSEERSWLPFPEMARRAASFRREHVEQSIRHLSPALQELLCKLLSNEPAHRHGSAAELGRALRACMTQPRPNSHGAGAVAWEAAMARAEAEAVDKFRSAYLVSVEAQVPFIEEEEEEPSFKC